VPAPSIAILTDAPSATLQFTRDTLAQFAVPFHEWTITDPAQLRATTASAEAAGVAVFLVANTKAIPLSAAVAAQTTKPVLAIPLDSPDLPPLEALQSATQPGPPVGVLAIGKAGATNAALLAVAILANTDPTLREKLAIFRQTQTAKVLATRLS
jgi:5-(carboxyamino)imidazole ribonucleotide mutase